MSKKIRAEGGLLKKKEKKSAAWGKKKHGSGVKLTRNPIKDFTLGLQELDAEKKNRAKLENQPRQRGPYKRR